MRPLRARFLAAITGIAGAVVLSSAPAASALSCVGLDGREQAALKRADAAIVGTVESTRAVPRLLTPLTDGNAGWDDAVFTIRVTRVFKGSIPRTIDVVGSSQYPIPTFGPDYVGGYLLHRGPDGWFHTDPCSELDARTLERVAGPGRKPRSGTVVVHRYELFEPGRTALAAGVLLGLVGAGVVGAKRLRRRRRQPSE